MFWRKKKLSAEEVAEMMFAFWGRQLRNFSPLLDASVEESGGPSAEGRLLESHAVAGLATAGTAIVPLIASVPLRVGIDIKPGEFPNLIRLGEKNKIKVAILSTSTFDAVTDVDIQSLTFGVTGEEQSLDTCKVQHDRHRGRGSLECRFRTALTSIVEGVTFAVLKGKTNDGVMIIGTDSIVVLAAGTEDDDTEESREASSPREVWRYDAKFTAMGHFAVLAREGGTEAVIAERNKGLLFFDAITGKVRSTVQLTGRLTDVFRISGSDGHRYLMGLSGAGHVPVLTTAGELVRVTPNIGVFHAATSQGDNPVLFIAPRDTLYTLDEQLQRAGDWYAPQSADLRISAVDRSGGPNGIVIALFIGSGSARDKTGLYVFGPDRRLLHTETSLSPNSGLLLLSSSEHSVAFLVGDRGRTWRYAVTW